LREGQCHRDPPSSDNSEPDFAEGKMLFERFGVVA